MKSFYMVVPIIFLFFAGCSSTYRVTDYPCAVKFHEGADNSIKNRDVNVVTVDSSFTSLAGSRINDTTLLTVSKIPGKISLNEIKDIKYFGNSYEAPSASILLKSGEELNTKDIAILPDSSVQFINIINDQIPLTDVKYLSYKNHWTGLGMGIFYGIVSGAAIGATGWIIRAPEDGMPSNDKWNSGDSAVFGAMFGIVIGAFAGAIIGWNIIYQFNP